MKLPKNLKKYIEWSFYATLFFLVISAGAGAYYWTTFQSMLTALEAKDPDRYQEMVIASKEVEFPKAWELFKKIDAMTDVEVVLLRHEKWKKKWADDPEFRDSQLEARSDRNDALKADRLDEYERKSERLIALRVSDTVSRKEAWQKKSPWQRSVLLKESCLYFRELEQRHSVERRRMDRPARQESFLTEQRATGLTASEECDQWIVLGHSEKEVARSLHNLRGSMNYYFFKRMSDALGLPDKAQHSLENRLAKMTHDYESY